MSLLKTLKGQILLVSVGSLMAGLMALTTANYLTARSQAHASLAAQSQALAHSHIEALRDWARSKARVVESAVAALDDADAAKPLNMLAKAAVQRFGLLAKPIRQQRRMREIAYGCGKHTQILL